MFETGGQLEGLGGPCFGVEGQRVRLLLGTLSAEESSALRRMVALSGSRVGGREKGTIPALGEGFLSERPFMTAG